MYFVLALEPAELSPQGTHADSVLLLDLYCHSFDFLRKWWANL